MVIWRLARRDLNLGGFPIDVCLMPRVLAWFGDDSNETNANLIQYHDPLLLQDEINVIRLDSIYRILRSNPNLCKVEHSGPIDGIEAPRKKLRRAT